MRLSSSIDTSKDNSQSERKNKLEELNTILNEPALKATARLSILITLALNTKLTFTELLTITSIGKGSLSNHIEKLTSNGVL